MKKNIRSVKEISFKLEDFKNDDLSKEESPYVYDYKEYLNQTYNVLKTNISYLKDTQALTESDTTLFVGRTGIGKTDLAVTQMVELLLNGHRIYVYVSEGKIPEYFQQIEEIFRIKRKNTIEIDQLLSNLIIKDKFTLTILDSHNFKQWVDTLIKDIKGFNCKVLFIDNISTTAFSWAGPTIESGFISYLSSQINFHFLIGLLYIHTSRSSSNFKINNDEIRGNSSNSHFVSNIFALNDITISGEQLRIIEPIKCRVDGNIKGTYYQLEYKKLKKRGFYSKSFKISEKEANRYFFQNGRKALTYSNQAK